ncbi:glycerophosphodiester phosphodiesterase [Paenibacillus sp. CGMCC 1.16610]|uniref:Glycerophosphodiester phosphodiesterase n=1 Tax=Paenibacillus anseongense TaxID=2682845 RepID=A0ABW9U411_9BACL|nr:MULTISPECIES: glycerophosphodiester phosphodiesterase [Paenibacillus]MBA2938865.1 glycerophosphodiester phosphodiesterase [Paenibacillus sp. CGMCC 1.16610]MVQ34827.1 glycerophosphodiester phosphodiesterase [Paenibacillus anseongense]
MNWQNAKTLVLAHRGSASEAPENTMAALRLALQQQCDAIELDIHLTKDGEIVVCHDETLDRTTNLRGCIGEMTLADIRQADAGSWFSDQYAGEPVPLLREVLELVPLEIGLNVELKLSYGGSIEHKVVALLREYGRLSSVIFSSFDHRMLYRLKQLAPEARISLVYAGKLLRPLRLIEDFELEVEAVSLHHAMVEREDVMAIRNSGRQVIVWTVNEEEAMKRMLECGVSAIITDYPAKLRRIVG